MSKKGQGAANCLTVATIGGTVGAFGDAIKNPPKIQFSSVSELATLLGKFGVVPEGNILSGATKLGRGAFKLVDGGVQAEFNSLFGAELLAAVNSSGVVCYADVDTLKVSVAATSPDNFGVQLFTDTIFSSVDLLASYTQQGRDFHFGAEVSYIDGLSGRTTTIDTYFNFSDIGDVKVASLATLLKDANFQAGTGSTVMTTGSGTSASFFLSQRSETSWRGYRSPIQVSAFIESRLSMWYGPVSVSVTADPADLQGIINQTRTVTGASAGGTDFQILNSINAGLKAEF
jgi:hypothetical protein